MINKSFFTKIKKFFHKKKKFLPEKLLIDLQKQKFKIIQTHKNNTGVIFVKEKKIYKKFSFNKEGAYKIKDEARGIKWYQKKIKIFI